MTDKEIEIRGKSVVVWEFCRDMEKCDCLEGRCPLEDLCNNNQIQDIEFDYDNEDDIKKIEEAYKIVMEDMEEVKTYSLKEIKKLLGAGLSDKDFEKMREAISNYCDGRHCDDCLMSLKCPRGREEPWIKYCEDWDKEEIVEAYRCIEGEI